MLLVKASAADALARPSLSLSLPAGGAGEGKEASFNGSKEFVAPFVTHGVPLLPHEEMELMMPAQWGKTLASQSASQSISVFLAKGDGQVGTIGTLAQVLEVLGDAREEEEGVAGSEGGKGGEGGGGGGGGGCGGARCVEASWWDGQSSCAGKGDEFARDDAGCGYACD